MTYTEGFDVIQCDGCGHEGHTEAQGWHYDDETGETLCEKCTSVQKAKER